MHLKRLVAVAGYAVLYLGSATAAHGQTADSLYAQGVKARQEQHFEEAAGLLKRVLALQPTNADALVQLGFTELGLNDLQSARSAFSQALSIAPAYTDATFGLAQVEFRSGNLNAALAIVEPLASAQPGNKEFLSLLESVRRAKQADAKATDAPSMKKARLKSTRKQVRPDPIASLVERGHRLRSAGKFAEAEDAYRKVLAISPHNTDVLVALGLVAGSQKKFDEAGQFFDAALAIDAKNLDARLGNVRLAIWQGDTKRARALVDDVLRVAPSNSEALALDARISLLERDYEQAEQSFAGLVAADPKNVEALVGLGDALRARGENAGARQAYRQALDLESGSREIEDRLSVPPPRKWRLDVGSEVSELSAGRGTWSDSAIGVAYQLSPDTTIGARTRLATRFGRTDLQIEGRIDHVFAPPFSAYALVAATPDADFLAQFSVGAGASWRAIPGAGGVGPVFINIDTRYDVFTDTQIATVSPWLQAYVFNERLAFSARWIHAEDDIGTTADGYALRADLTATERLRLFAGYSDAPEISEGTLAETRTVFAGVSVDVTDRFTLAGSYAHEQRAAFDRDTVGLNLTTRF
ncbi:MAG: YaiO family outer membrane beta-barrel protein [Mesorhizobium sp.]|uniref:tetratricopeptide repeat protein n=1 Tax=Mesorhizobium sp. TaxID=1871066 RepID=UPI0012076F56|nr:tetratricopeptide repeat protein [Mesorhizobium sp.]TIN03936.1 MAG: YaiO family outer membrane beta-barrel protein [Mesorhizobium sp.]